MYLSRMPLDITKRKTMTALSMPGLFHGAVESSFRGERQRNLWRVDLLSGNRYLLILSPEVPDLSSAVEQFGFPDIERPWETRDYLPLLERVQDGTLWNFRLTANPTKSCPSPDTSGSSERGSLKAHVSVKYQQDWLAQRAEKHGFSLQPDEFMVVGSQWYSFHKSSGQKNNVSLFSATYEGVLTVRDAALFKEMLLHGMGRGKAYGMGLMTIVSWKSRA